MLHGTMNLKFISIWLLFLVVILVNWVLIKFKVSKFCYNQSVKILNTVLVLLLVGWIGMGQ
jgi:HJR/Mrr/RecB family endonuclease